MNTTCIIPRSTIEKRYDKAREDFNDQYDNSPYKLKCKEFYLGGGVENYEVANKILLMNEEEIAKSYLEDCDPKDWQSMRRYREDLMCDATDIYKTAIAMVKADIQKLKNIQDEVESFLDDHIGDRQKRRRPHSLRRIQSQGVGQRRLFNATFRQWLHRYGIHGNRIRRMWK